MLRAGIGVAVVAIALGIGPRGRDRDGPGSVVLEEQAATRLTMPCLFTFNGEKADRRLLAKLSQSPGDALPNGTQT